MKEVDTLTDQGYDVTVIYCFYQQWAEEFDKKLLDTSKAKFICCGGTPQHGKLLHYKTRLRQKLCQKLFKITPKAGIAENAISRTHAEALAAAKSIKSDLYIAHNLGALPAAVLAAKHHGTKAGYDAEDMHSGQFENQKDVFYLINKYIEEKYFPSTSYFTAASSLIARAYKEVYQYLKPVTIDNVFPKVGFQFKERVNQPLKLFWFSQTVGEGRGLEDIITALSKVKAQTEFHLLGKCSVEYQQRLQALCRQTGYNADQLIIHAPIAPVDIFQFANQFDIGMATELNTPLNRDICLTNKIFTYIQSGLAVIASNTQAQQAFLHQHPQAGKLYTLGNIESLTQAVKFYVDQPEALANTRINNYSLGQQTLNWETESKKFMDVLMQTLS